MTENITYPHTRVVKMQNMFTFVDKDASFVTLHRLWHGIEGKVHQLTMPTILEQNSVALKLTWN